MKINKLINKKIITYPQPKQENKSIILKIQK